MQTAHTEGNGHRSSAGLHETPRRIPQPTTAATDRNTPPLTDAQTRHHRSESGAGTGLQLEFTLSASEPSGSGIRRAEA